MNDPLKHNRPINLLIAERDKRLRDLMAAFLLEAGFAVAFADDGQMALEKAQASLPDLLITEILVPKLDGLALCRRLKADAATRDIAVVVFSILAAGVRAAEAGADAFLKKPLAEAKLIETVKHLLKRPR